MSTSFHATYTKIEIKIGIVVAFDSIENGSELDRLIRQLKIEVEAFDGFVEEGLPADRLKEKAQTVNATFRAVLELIAMNPSRHPSQHSCWVRESIETAAAILKRYDDAAHKGLGHIARDKLAHMAKEFYARTAGRHIDARFIWNLKFYEWLKSKHLLGGTRWSVGYEEAIFTDDELEDFFRENEDAVLRRMLTCNVMDGKIYLESPLDHEKKNYFEAFRLAPSHIRDIDKGASFVHSSL